MFVSMHVSFVFALVLFRLFLVSVFACFFLYVFACVSFYACLCVTMPLHVLFPLVFVFVELN